MRKKKKTHRFSKVGLALISLFIALLLSEFFLRWRMDINPSTEYQEFEKQEHPQPGMPKKHFVARRYQPKRAHPYIGFVYNDLLLERINSDGFRDLHEFPYTHGKDEFVIGVFGGSFASDFAEAQEFKQIDKTTTFADRILALNPPALKGKKITVLNFGLASGRQPQQYIAMSLYLDFLDMVIVIDGFNEAYRNRDLNFPTYFPDYAKFFFSKSGGAQEHWSELFKLRKIQTSLAETITQNRFLRSSRLIFYMWRAYGAYVDDRVKTLSKNEWPINEFPENISRDDYNLQKAKIWTKYARMQANMLKGEHIPFLHVLQPNQHMPGTKPLSAEEKEKFLWPMHDNLESAIATYQLILEERKDLEKSGYKILDYTRIFENHPETLYRDGCCHLNPQGYDLLEEALAPEVVKVLKAAHKP